MLATAIWVAVMLCLLVVEYFDQGVNCHFGPWVDYGGVERCGRFLWYWKRGTSDLFTRTYYVRHEMRLVYWPDVARLSTALVLIPATLWSLASGVGWVRRGFKSGA